MTKQELKTQAREYFAQIHENLTQIKENLSLLRKTFSKEYAEIIRDLCSDIIDKVDGELTEVLEQLAQYEEGE